MTPHQLSQVEQSIGYTFNNKDLLIQALTHRSYGPVNNERMEFLGDSMLGLVVTRLLYMVHPHDDEGALSRRKALIVKKESLAELGRNLGLDGVIKVGPGEVHLQRHDSMVEDAVEATIGAVVLDCGDLNVIEEWVKQLIKPIMYQGEAQGVSLKDSKTQLQELLQLQHQPLPSYRVESVGGPTHCQVFTVALDCSHGTTKGVGASRRKAEQNAARLMMERITHKA